MISYSTNWMGPISMDWYEKNGVDYEKVKYSGGRIDIYGLDPEEFWGGRGEHSLPLMRTEDWNLFSDWLDDFESEELMSLIEILQEYRQDTGHVIRWWKDDEWLNVLEEWKNAEESEVSCKTHPDAPHGFNRNASHSMGRYVCNCEFWEEK